MDRPTPPNINSIRLLKQLWIEVVIPHVTYNISRAVDALCSAEIDRVPALQARIAALKAMLRLPQDLEAALLEEEKEEVKYGKTDDAG